MPPSRIQQYAPQPAPPSQPISAGGVESEADQLDTAYSLLLLSEYTHTLDSLPLDLSRNFADLRELDAVLSSSMQSITTKIKTLTDLIEAGTATKEERIWMLNEIYDEAHRLKLGGEDKIRVACLAADNLKLHNSHLRTLTDTLPGFDTSVLIRKTMYPHVSAQSFMPVHTNEHGRRRRNVQGSLLTVASNNADPSPAKRKRVVNRDEDIDIGSIKSPRKERVETTGRGRGVNNRVKKVNERAASPAESVLSVNYRQPSQNARSAGTTSRGAGAANGGGATNKRSRGNASATSNSNNRNGTPITNDSYNGAYDPRYANGMQANGSGSASSRRGGADYAGHGAGYQNGSAGGVGMANGDHQQMMQAYAMHDLHMQNWNAGQPLEGPGMPVSRGAASASAQAQAISASASANVGVDNMDGTDGDGDGEPDERRYCICQGVSYGEMIACDQDGCEREWFHLSCTGLSVAPTGKWYCDDCKLKRTGKRTGRGGKRRAGGGRGANA